MDRKWLIDLLTAEMPDLHTGVLVDMANDALHLGLGCDIAPDEERDKDRIYYERFETWKPSRQVIEEMENAVEQSPVPPGTGVIQSKEWFIKVPGREDEVWVVLTLGLYPPDTVEQEGCYMKLTLRDDKSKQLLAEMRDPHDPSDEYPVRGQWSLTYNDCVYGVVVE